MNIKLNKAEQKIIEQNIKAIERDRRFLESVEHKIKGTSDIIHKKVLEDVVYSINKSIQHRIDLCASEYLIDITRTLI